MLLLAPSRRFLLRVVFRSRPCASVYSCARCTNQGHVLSQAAVPRGSRGRAAPAPCPNGPCDPSFPLNPPSAILSCELRVRNWLALRMPEDGPATQEYWSGDLDEHH